MTDVLKILRDAEDTVGGVLQDIGFRPYPMYIRTTTRTGDDPNLGVKGTETVTDALIEPNPDVKLVNLAMVQRTGGYLKLGDIVAEISANIEKSTLEDAEYFVYQDELWKLIRLDGKPMLSAPEIWVALLRKHES